MASIAALSALGGCTVQTAQEQVQLGPAAIRGRRPEATVEMSEIQAAYIGSASAGRGVLVYRERRHPFTVEGVGVGGVGASSIEAEGDVYDLRELSRFPGTYGQARYGFAVGEASAGDLWMQNENGVIMRLKARRTGLMLSLGGDAMLITMQG